MLNESVGDLARNKSTKGKQTEVLDKNSTAGGQSQSVKESHLSPEKALLLAKLLGKLIARAWISRHPDQEKKKSKKSTSTAQKAI